MRKIESNRQFAVHLDKHRHDPIKVTIKSRRGKKASHHMTAGEARRLRRSLRKAIIFAEERHA